MGGIISGVGNALFGDQSKGPGPQQTNLYGAPNLSQYTSTTDSKGNLLPQFMLTGAENYAPLANQQLATNVATARDQATQQAQGAQNAARDSLASHGGLSGGSAAQLARANQQGLMNANQGVTQSQLNAQNQNALNQFGLTQQQSQYNIGNALNQNNMNNNLVNSAYGAQQTANAMAANAPKPKGGLVGGALNTVGNIFGKG